MAYPFVDTVFVNISDILSASQANLAAISAAMDQVESILTNVHSPTDDSIRTKPVV